MKNLLIKHKSKINKIISALSVILFYSKTNCFGAVVEETGKGGNIAKSELFQGFYDIAVDLTGTLQWIIPTVGLVFIAFYVFKIMTRR